jgi:hypothetical protein
MELLKQHYHELIEQANQKIVENEQEQERLKKDLHVMLK